MQVKTSALENWLAAVHGLGDNPLQYAGQLQELGYRTPEGILAAENARELSDDTGIPLGAARIIWKAAAGTGGPALGYNLARWNNHRGCSELAAFVKAVHAQKELVLHPEPGTVIGLGGNAVWLGMPSVASADLYVRTCYPELFRAKEEYIKERKFTGGCMTVFTGTPGVGKSHLAALFVAQELLKGSEVLLECMHGSADSLASLQRHYYWLTSSGDVEHTKDDDVAHMRLKECQKSVVYVTDGCAPGIDRDSWTGHSVTFCSPQKSLWRPEKKGLRVLYLYVPVLELGELLSMKRALPAYQSLSEKSVQDWYSWAGGVARACLKMNSERSHGLEAWKGWVSSLLSKATTAELLVMIRYDGLETFVEGSDRIFHWFFAAELPKAAPDSPKDNRLRRYSRRCVRFATQNVRDLALTILDLSKLADVAVACLENSRASTGYWLELLACRFLQMGNVDLDAALLDERGKERTPFKLNIPTATVAHWSSQQQAAERCKIDMSVLCLPHAKNEPGIDAISSPCLYWQVTKAEHHQVVRDALYKMNVATDNARNTRKQQLDALRQRITWTTNVEPVLSMPLLCFIVTPHRFDTSYKCRQPYTKNGKPTVAQSEIVHQCVVRLPLETILDSCSDRVAVNRFMGLVEELPIEESGDAMEICGGDVSSHGSSIQLERPSML